MTRNWVRLLAMGAIVVSAAIVPVSVSAFAPRSVAAHVPAVVLSAADVPARRSALPTTADDDSTVVVYGDSLAWEAEAVIGSELVASGVGDVRLHTYGGTAICDWLDEMREDAAELRPTVVVVEFSGNAFTPCMTGPDGVTLAASREAYFEKYTHDASEVIDIFAGTGTRIVFVSAPIGRGVEERHDPDTGRLNRIYQDLALSHPGTAFVDAAAAVLWNGHYTDVLPCLPSEPCTGAVDANGIAVNVVRAPDGGHFCPGAADANRGVTERCPVWSSGAYRYGSAIAAGVIMQLASSRTR
jgi:hypothetical protein